MAITVQEINAATFEKSKKGYSAEQVDAFIDRIAGEVASMQKELDGLRHENEAQRGVIESYKSRENAIDRSLLEASNLRKEIIEKAKADAEGMVKEGELALEQQRNRLEQLKQEEEQTVRRIRYILQAQLSNLEYLLKEQ